jgi:glycosyltransferase involved in cell wall biosynthesis
MACGVPVVATDTGGIPEVVTNGETGYLAAVGDVDSLADRSIEILRDADLWKRMSAASRHAAEQFGADRVVTCYEDYYKEVLAK